MFASRLYSALFRPVDIASLVFFRVAFGLIMAIEAWRYFEHDWITRYYVLPEFHFKYYGFSWVEPWPGDGMYWHFAALGALALCIMLGAFYRVAMVLYVVGFAYVFLLDQTQYLNHFYLVILIAFLMCFLPANRAFSVDAWLWPRLASQTVPGWAVWTLVAQFELMLLYAGFVKITPDWLQLEPLGSWLSIHSGAPLIGRYLTEPWVIAMGAYGVILLHIVGAPLLLWRRTRLAVFLTYCAFHLSNHFAFHIGIFPWFTIVGTLMFFEPDWPRRVGRWIVDRATRLSGRAAGRRTPLEASARERLPLVPEWSAGSVAVVALLGAWLLLQLLLPLRHYTLPGDVAWNEDGHRFSWRMKLRDKDAYAIFLVRDPATGESWEVDPRYFLTPRQARKMSTRPDMILQFAHYLDRLYREEDGLAGLEIRAKTEASLNGRPYTTFVDPEKDLTKITRAQNYADWILPLTIPLPEERRWVRR